MTNQTQARIYRDGLFGRRPAVPVGSAALAAAARRRMSRVTTAYIDGSAGTESTAAANRAAFDRWKIVPRMLRDVAHRDLSVELLGRRHETPFLLAPIGVLELAHREADLAVARAAAASGVTMLMSTQASVPMEDCAAAMGESGRWFQLYYSRDKELTASLVSRAETAGFEAIVVTLDTHTLGWRPRDLDLAYLPFARGLGLAQYTSDPVFQRLAAQRPPGVTAPPSMSALRALVSMSRRHPGGFWRNLTSPLPRAAVETFLDVFPHPSFTWDDIAFLRQQTTLPILLKGILSPDDAVRAVEAGADGVIVSNHGGRQVDGAIGALDALAGVASAVDSAIPVLFDSGVRSGSDAFTALALGADAVCLGRPYVYGLALAGENGVREVLSHFIGELDLTLGLSGHTRVTDLTPDCLQTV